ncbi:MAG: leucine-rich repeat domain-containing protein [Chitinophagaceae bacterium]|nr:leucine-rich repeat domain-containing protein [Chitinophagaceae bacterium]
MNELNKCNLFIFGNNAVGKTTLINILNEEHSFKYKSTRQSYSTADWTIRNGKDRVLVEIKEAANLSQNFINIIKKREELNPIILLVIRVNQNNKINDSDIKWLDNIRSLSENSIVMVAFTFVNKTSSKINLAPLRLKYPFIRYFFFIPIIDRERYEGFYDFANSLSQIIINAFTDKLAYVKSLVKENLKSQNKYLDIGRCNLTSLFEIKELFKNTHLETLIISNEWGEYEKGQWVRKVSTNRIGENVLFDLPREIQNLKNLKTLIIGGNWKSKKRSDLRAKKWHIENISVLAKLLNLRILNASNNEITSVSQIQKLENLTSIYLNNNNISSIPDLSNLKSLKEIFLSNNKIKEVSFLKNLKQIRSIDLHSNDIRDLSPLRDLITKKDIKDSKWEVNAISISNNPMLSIPSLNIISQGRKSILSYFKQLDAEQRINLKPFFNNDIKLILVGNSNAGKSTLTEWLIENKIDKNVATTHWMNVVNWQAIHKGKDYKIRIFDFGGQEYYHDTHHLFFTNRTAYVVLWEGKTNCFDEIEVQQIQLNNSVKSMNIQTFPLEYWLDSIKFHSIRRNKTQSEKGIEKLLDKRDEDIENSIKEGQDWTQHVINTVSNIENELQNDENVLIVQNKVDMKNNKFFLNQKLLKNNHQNIFDFHSISVYQEKGIDYFMDLLFEIFNSMEIVTTEYFGTWGHIKKAIEKDAFTEPFDLSKFKIYCNDKINEIPELVGKSVKQKHGVLFNDDDTKTFAQYLCDIGIALYYPESSLLRDKVFLNQSQILSNIYRILLDLNELRGEFDQNKIVKSLGKKSVDNEVIDITNLMLHFKIIFEHPSKTKHYIAPLYLPKEPNQSLKLFLPLFIKPAYRYQYKTFVYKNVILDFFHTYGKKALKEVDNHDLYYYWREGIVVRSEINDEIIMVKFFPGNNEGGNAYIDIYPIKELTRGAFMKQIIEDLDRINEVFSVTKCVTVNGEDFIPLEVILKNEKENNWIFSHEDKYFKLTEFKKFLVNPIKMKKILISYSKQDLKYVTKFVEHLSALQLDGKVSHWYCSELKAGSEWDKEIQKHIDEADIICFLISPNFMKTQYIHEHEISKAFEKKKADPNFKIVPIILDFCRWSTIKHDLSQFTALPYTAKPVADFSNENMAWYIIEECLRLMIDEDLNPMGETFYSAQHLPADVLKIYKGITDNRVDKHE